MCFPSSNMCVRHGTTKSKLSYKTSRKVKSCDTRNRERYRHLIELFLRKMKNLLFFIKEYKEYKTIKVKNVNT